MSWHKILLSQPQIISPLYLLTSSTVTNVLLSHLGTYFYWFLLFPPYSKHSNQSDPLIIWIRWSVQLSHSVLPDSLWPHGLQQARLPCPSPIPGVYSNSCLLSHWCHPTILSSVVPFSSCFHLSQHQDLFQWVSSSHQVAKVLKLQHQSFQWLIRTNILLDWLVCSPCSPRDC